MKHALICPVCAETLSLGSAASFAIKSVSCPNNHLYDVAKQGYLNLLLSQHKKSKHPGDTLEMVQARTEFLDNGFYAGISQHLQEICLEHITNSAAPTTKNNRSTLHYSDLACGEGFYTHHLHQALTASPLIIEQFTQINSIGLDISTPAIKAACRKTKEIQWLVASLARIPISDHSQHLVTGLFFHFDLNEIKRILKPQGIFIMVTTGADHLIELRNEIYETLKVDSPKDFSNIQGELSHIKTRVFRDQKRLNSAVDILNLLKMTPHYWRCTHQKKQHLERLSTLDITIDIQFDIFIRQ